MQKGVIKDVNPITGQTIGAKDLASLFYSLIGERSGIIRSFENLSLEKIDNNTFRLKGGVYSLKGYLLYIQKESHIEFVIQSGSTGTKRIDLLVAEYTKEGDGVGEDTLEFKIIQGASTTGSVEPPTLIQQDINANGITRQEVLYRIDIEGVTATETKVAQEIPGLQSLEEMINEIVSGHDGSGYHNSVYRGKNLGSSVTEEQKARIRDGTFRNLFIGDYWSIGGVNYRIAAFNYFLNTGDTALEEPHVTLVPDNYLYLESMNETNTTQGAYAGSSMRTSGLNSAKTRIENAFGPMLLTHRQYLSTTVTDGAASLGEWVDASVELMNEHMVYGSNAAASSNTENGHRFNINVSKTQLPLFFYRHDLIGIRSSWWLRDVVSASFFARVTNTGNSGRHYASHAYGVRPAFSIS